MRDEAGQVIVFSIVAMVVLLALTGFAVDVGHAYLVQRQLQSAADASALAGALELPDATRATQVANDYGAGAGGRNPATAAGGATMSVTVKCVTSIPGCSGGASANAINVKATSDVPTFFARVVGFDSFTVNASATACSPCNVKPIDIMLVLDRTGSMCQKSDGTDDHPACTDLANARSGMKTFLGLMDPAYDRVGLAVLPPATNVSQRCSAVPSSNNYNYNLSTAAYTVVPLSSDYASPAGTLNTGSALVSTINCIQAGGRTAYAKAIEQAQAELERSGRPGAQRVIVLLSDGAANTGDTTLGNSSPYNSQPCHQGIFSSNVSKTKGTTVYTIGYDLNGAGTDYEKCHPSWWSGGANSQLESPTITALQAMQGIASAPDTFYNKPDPGQLNTIFARIAAEVIHTAQLIDDSTP